MFIILSKAKKKPKKKNKKEATIVIKVNVRITTPDRDASLIQVRLEAIYTYTKAYAWTTVITCSQLLYLFEEYNRKNHSTVEIIRIIIFFRLSQDRRGSRCGQSPGPRAQLAHALRSLFSHREDRTLTKIPGVSRICPEATVMCATRSSALLKEVSYTSDQTYPIRSDKTGMGEDLAGRVTLWGRRLPVDHTFLK
ncbi:hypothetical protein TNCV_3044231 [Trichonephila clavipes]|nr:hypothetical protein TNCV_3044231 [Trichonephila clavipes]